MKLSTVTLLASMVYSVQADFNCTLCFDGLDDARDCLRVCNSDGLLDGCIARTDTDFSGSDKISDINDFVDCCQMDNGCQGTFGDSSECVNECIDDCVKTTPKAYMECIADEMEDQNQNCGRQACLDGFLNEDGLQQNLGIDNDVLEFSNLKNQLNNITAKDFEECKAVEPFVTEVCKIGTNCCSDCDAELASVVDCVINDVMIPFVAIELNTSIAECPISTTSCQLARRDLSESQVNKVNAFLNKARTEEQKSRRTRMLTKVEDCQEALTTGILVTNVTDGSNKYMECVMDAATEALSDVDEGTEAPGGESGSAKAFAAGLVAAIAGFVAMI